LKFGFGQQRFEKTPDRMGGLISKLSTNTDLDVVVDLTG
jgi:hypothetical protein